MPLFQHVCGLPLPTCVGSFGSRLPWPEYQEKKCSNTNCLLALMQINHIWMAQTCIAGFLDLCNKRMFFARNLRLCSTSITSTIFLHYTDPLTPYHPPLVIWTPSRILEGQLDIIISEDPFIKKVKVNCLRRFSKNQEQRPLAGIKMVSFSCGDKNQTCTWLRDLNKTQTARKLNRSQDRKITILPNEVGHTHKRYLLPRTCCIIFLMIFVSRSPGLFLVLLTHKLTGISKMNALNVTQTVRNLTRETATTIIIPR